MQIKYLRKNIYKLYCSVFPENTKSEFIKNAEKNNKIIGNNAQTKYSGIIKSKRPKKLHKSRFNKDIWNLIRKIRTEKIMEKQKYTQF